MLVFLYEKTCLFFFCESALYAVMANGNIWKLKKGSILKQYEKERQNALTNRWLYDKVITTEKSYRGSDASE